MEHFGELPYVSKAHLKKHLALAHLRITDRQIEATERTEDGERTEKYREETELAKPS